MIYQTIQKCRISKKRDLVSVGKFNEMSLTGTFPKSRNHKIHRLPFEVVYSKSSKLLQLKHNYDSKLLYGDNYGYLSSLNPIMVNHLKRKSLFLKKRINLKKNNFILDIGSNDGTFINFFNGKNLFGIDPSIKKLKKYYKRNIRTIPKIFEKGFKLIKKNKFKLISANAMFYDLTDPVLFMKKVGSILEQDGIFHIEVAYLPEIIKTFEDAQLTKDLPNIYVGDTVRVGVRISEGNKERVQPYEGVVIAKRHGGINKTITVRRIFQGIGVDVSLLPF